MTPQRWQQVNELFHLALQRPTSERLSFLSAACSTDHELLSEVTSLLRAHEEAGHLIDEPAAKIAAEFIGEPPGASLLGREIGKYKVVDRIGSGGMGEVYLAIDLQLNRKVALKVLPSQLVYTEIRLRRFVQEAKAASALNHPNIITIHEIGEADGVHFIVAEFVEGITLRQRIRQGPVELGEILAIAKQIAAALAAAHEAGITHRDIKPENIMLRPDGYVKVLDFGLATLTEKEPGRPDQRLPNISWVESEPGTIMGTVHYMSPEQARGLPVDARSDVFSLGVVIYEMMTGLRPFDGPSPSDVIVAILTKDPAPLGDHPNAASQLQPIIANSLSKDRAERYRDAREMLRELETLTGELAFRNRLSQSSKKRSYEIRPSTRRRAIVFVLAIACVAATLIAIRYTLNLTGSESRRGAGVELREIDAWKSGAGYDTPWGTFSPDGKMVAFSSNKGGVSKIWVKQLIANEPVSITKGDWTFINPIWSPDGQQLAFVSNKGNRLGIWVSPVLDVGAATALTQFEDVRPWPRLIRWSADGKRIYYELSSNLFVVEITSGNPTALTHFTPVDHYPNSFAVSPFEDRIAYVDGTAEQRDIWVEKFGGERLRITSDGDHKLNLIWHPDGNRLVYSSSRNEILQLFIGFANGGPQIPITATETNSLPLDISGDGNTILISTSREESDIWATSVTGRDEYEVSSAVGAEFWPDLSVRGMLAFHFIRDAGAGRSVVEASIMARPIGEPDQEILLTGKGYDAKWCPDGNKLAFIRGTGREPNIWVVGDSGTGETQVTRDGIMHGGFFATPYLRRDSYSWSPNCGEIALYSKKSGYSNLYVVSSDGYKETNLTNISQPGIAMRYAPVWSRSGDDIAYSCEIPGGTDNGKKWVVFVTGKHGPRPTFETDLPVRVIGWYDSGRELIALQTTQLSSSLPSVGTVDLILISIRTGVAKIIATLDSVYFSNVYLSPDGSQVGFAARRDNKDNVWLIPAAGGREVQLTTNHDSVLRVSSLVWSPDSKLVYYGKEWRQYWISSLTNYN